MKKITQLTIAALLAISFIACGSSGNTKTNPTTEPTATPTPPPVATIIAIEECIDPAVIESYTMILSKDSIVDVSGDAVVMTYHDQEDVKSICLVSGDAHISRPPSN